MEKYLLILLLLSGCSRGPHVSTYDVYTHGVKFTCEYSERALEMNHRIAICETEKECNEICARLPK